MPDSSTHPFRVGRFTNATPGLLERGPIAVFEGGAFLGIIDGRVVGFAALDFNTFEPDTVILGVWMLREVRRRGIGTALAEYALGFARDKGYTRIRGRLPQDNEVALTFLSSIGALVPIYNPEARFELPLV